MDIICIDDHFTPKQIADIPNRPVRDKIYSIRDVVHSAKGTGVLLNEIHNPKDAGWVILNGMKMTFEPNFSAKRFATLDGSVLTVEILRELNVKSKVEIE